jgi:hypothetical protein
MPRLVRLAFGGLHRLPLLSVNPHPRLCSPAGCARALSASCDRSSRSVLTNPFNNAMKGPTTATVMLSQVEPVIRLSIPSSPIL